jgi:hypothetical protein
MIFGSLSRPIDGARRLAIRAAMVIAILALASPAGAATVFYKWVTADGQVHYSDTVPKGFTGAVTRVEVDTGASRAPVSPGVSAEERAIRGESNQPDLLEQRRETRSRLQASLDSARQRLELAQQALADGQTPGDDEWQVTQKGQPHGPGQVHRSNCHKGADGHLVCPGRVPSETYYKRLDTLQHEVDLAQAAVDEAERAYRRGVD